jgi:hypothetical protein
VSDIGAPPARRVPWQLRHLEESRLATSQGRSLATVEPDEPPLPVPLALPEPPLPVVLALPDPPLPVVPKLPEPPVPLSICPLPS